MLITESFPSEYLRAADLQGKNVRAVISHIEVREVGDGHKPVIFFQGKDKGVVLNKTNANNIASAYGDDTDDWAGKEVILYGTMVDFQGRSVAAIRIRRPMAADNPKLKPMSATGRQSENPAVGGGLPDDDIPFAPEWR